MSLDEEQRKRIRKVKNLIVLLQNNVKNNTGAGSFAKSWLTQLGESGDITETIKLLEKLGSGSLVVNEEDVLQGHMTPVKSSDCDNKKEIDSAIPQILSRLSKVEEEVNILKEQLRLACNAPSKVEETSNSQNVKKGFTQMVSEDVSDNETISKDIQNIKVEKEKFDHENNTTDKIGQALTEKKENVLRKIEINDKAISKVKELINRYNILYDNGRNFRTDLKLILPDSEVNMRENNPAKDEYEKLNRATVLEEAGGNPNYYGEPIMEMSGKYFLFPVTSVAVNTDSLWTNAYGYFFEIKNKELLQTDNTKYKLVQPAIVEQRQDKMYYLLQRGCLQIIS